jgi:hypothetical protein
MEAVRRAGRRPYRVTTATGATAAAARPARAEPATTATAPAGSPLLRRARRGGGYTSRRGL